MKSSRSVRLVEKANKPTAPSELLEIYRKFGDYPVSQHGAQALWGRETMAGMADGGLAAYGMPVGGRLVGTPSFGIEAPGHGRDYRLGNGLTVAPGSWGCRAQLEREGRAGGGRRLLGNRRHGCADSPGLASGDCTGEVFFWVLFPVDLSTGLVVPTTCSLTICLTICMAIRNSEESREESIRNSEESRRGVYP